MLLSIELSAEAAANLEALAQQCSEVDAGREGATTHGPLDVLGLLAMLMEDAGMVLSRPGSWEASNMRRVLEGHGYEVG